MSERVRMFASGFEYDAWEERNCERCAKPPTCDLYDAVTESMIGDGTFSPEIVARFGYVRTSPPTLGWPCAEFVPAAGSPSPAGATP